MDVVYDLSDILRAVSEAEADVEVAMELIGEEAVEYAEANGDYPDRTGRLRRSNKYEVSKDGLTLYNDSDYASDIEQRGYDVISGAALFAERRLKEEFEL